MLLESMLSSLATPTDKCEKSSKTHIYAPECSTMTDVTIKPGIIMQEGGIVYQANSWASSCPGTGESW